MQRPHRRALPVPRWWADAAGVLVWLGMLVVVALWVVGGGLQDLADPLGERGLDSAGRLTGLISADLLLVQVLLMARVPFVERAFGQDELARRHRLVGFWSFDLMLAHVVLITLGYAAGDGKGVIREFVNLTLDYPGMLLAVAGTAALTAPLPRPTGGRSGLLLPARCSPGGWPCRWCGPCATAWSSRRSSPRARTPSAW